MTAENTRIKDLTPLTTSEANDEIVVDDVSSPVSTRTKKQTKGNFLKEVNQRIDDLTFADEFEVDDWDADGDFYKLDIIHGLDSTNLVVEVRESGVVVFVNSIENIDTNTIRIKVPVLPDLRFDGTISIAKIA